MDIIKVGLCDDYKYLCDTYKDILNFEENIDVLWTSGSITDCLEKLKENTPDILLLDIQMETKTEGIDSIKIIKSDFPQLKIIMLTGYDTVDYIFESFVNGASNYVLKEDSDENIIKTINDVYYNSIVIKDEIAKKLIEKSGIMYEQNRTISYSFNIMTKLTKTELEVLFNLAEGMSYKDISIQRCVEENTIRKTASNILSKFKAKNMKQLINSLNEYNVFDLFKEK